MRNHSSILVHYQNYQNRLVQSPQDIIVEFTLKHRPWTYIIHLCNAITIEINPKCQCVILAIKGNRQETILVHDYKQI